MVIVEGRQFHCWLGKQLGHIAIGCPQKMVEAPLKEPIKKSKRVSTPEPEDKQEGWTEVMKKKENEIWNHSKVHLCHPRQISCKGDNSGSWEQKGTSWNIFFPAPKQEEETN